MKPFTKYLLAVVLLLVCARGYISYVAWQKNKQPDFACEFDKGDLKRIASLARRQLDVNDETNAMCNNTEARELGKKIFFDERFSKNSDMSCATCHQPDQHWTSLQPQLKRDVPSLWNTAHNRWFFWDGRADSLWSQAAGPLESAAEQDGSRTQFAKIIYADKAYRFAYEKLFGAMPDVSDEQLFPERAKPSGEDAAAERKWKNMRESDRLLINRIFVNICKCIAAFEQSISSGKTRFDLFAEGISEKNQQKVNNLSAAEQRGLKIFIGKGECTLCHSGSNFSDREFHFIHLPLATGEKLEEARLAGAKELFDNPFNALGKYSDDTKGQRADNLTFLKIDPESIGHYKTPSLRNVAHTAPYMHDGQFKTLRQVIDFYSEMKGANENQPHLERVLRPLNLSEREKDDLEAFLRALSDSE